jgi:uncharacterized protein (DUF2147 family)
MTASPIVLRMVPMSQFRFRSRTDEPRMLPLGFSRQPMSRRWRLMLVVLCCAAVVCVARVAVAAVDKDSTPLGAWLTESGKGVVAIVTCGDALCGRIVGIDRAPGDPMPTDVQGKPQCGLTIITDERPARGGTWLGWVTDPRNGTAYRAELWMDRDGDLNLRGYVGVPLLGETQVWHRFGGRLGGDCRLM